MALGKLTILVIQRLYFPHCQVLDIKCSKVDQIFQVIFLKSCFRLIGTSFLKRSKHTISWGNWVLKEKPSISLHDSPLKTVLQDSDQSLIFCSLTRGQQGSLLCSGAPPAPPSHLGDSQQDWVGIYLFTDCRLQQTGRASKAGEVMNPSLQLRHTA